MDKKPQEGTNLFSEIIKASVEGNPKPVKKKPVKKPVKKK